MHQIYLSIFILFILVVFFRSSDPNPAGGAYDAPQIPWFDGEGDTLQRLILGAYSASTSPH